MSEFDIRENKTTRRNFWWIKVKVTLIFFNQVYIEIEEKKFNCFFKNEIENFAKKNNFKVTISEVEKPIVIRGHELYYLHETKKYVRIKFSK